MFKVEEKDDQTSIEYGFGNDEKETIAEKLVCEEIFNIISKDFKITWDDTDK